MTLTAARHSGRCSALVFLLVPILTYCAPELGSFEVQVATSGQWADEDGYAVAFEDGTISMVPRNGRLSSKQRQLAPKGSGSSRWIHGAASPMARSERLNRTSRPLLSFRSRSNATAVRTGLRSRPGRNGNCSVEFFPAGPMNGIRGSAG